MHVYEISSHLSDRINLKKKKKIITFLITFNFERISLTFAHYPLANFYLAKYV